jgi:hypothetical protein
LIGTMTYNQASCKPAQFQGTLIHIQELATYFSKEPDTKIF